MMPAAIYRRAKALQPGQRLSGAGLAPYQPRHAPNVRPGAVHQPIFAGMQQHGAQGHHSYMTFRTMTSTSPGWHVPARAGQPIAATVAREATPAILARIAEAFAQDVADHIQSTLSP
jgi:hypothetical protein